MGDDELVVIVIGDSEAALDRMRSKIGNDWMTENIVPYLAAPTDRLVGETVVSFQRS